MPGSGLLGRRKASFSTGKTSNGSNGAGTAYPGTSDKPPYTFNGQSKASGGVKLTLEDDDELDGSGEMEDGGIKVNNYSYGSNGNHAAAGFPVVGAGSRTKILSQLGEPAGLPVSPATQPYSGSRAGFSPLQATQSTSSLHSQPSPPILPREGSGVRPRHFRKGSAVNHKISLAGLKDFVTTSPVTTPTHLTGVLPPDEKGYYDFPWLRPSDNSGSVSPHGSRSRQSSSIGLPSTSEVAQYANVSPEPLNQRLRSHSKTNSGSMLSNLAPSASPAGRQLSAPPNTQTFNIGLPPVDTASKRSTYDGPPMPRAATTSVTLSPTSNGDDPFPSGLVSARSASFPEIDGPGARRPSATMPWPTPASSSRIAPADVSADDGQLEEIVPWLYQGTDIKPLASPQEVTMSPASRNRQVSMNSGSLSPRGLGSPNNLRASKSSTSVRPKERSGSATSADGTIAERERKSSNRFMGMLRKKSSAFVDAVSSSSGRDRDDSASASSSGPSSRQRLSPRDEELYSGRSKRGKKDKKNKDVTPPLPKAVAGISLDTNLDSMEGIVDLNKNTFPLNYSMSNPYEHLNAVTAGTSAPLPAPPLRPGTPPSPSQMPALRQPSLNGATKKFEFGTGDASTQDLSPLSKRLGLSRKESIDIQSTLQKWPASASALLSQSPPSDAPRKNSLASLINDRRDSGGTLNGLPSAVDAGWTAPDSWAVKSNAPPAKEEDSDDDDPRIKSDTAALGSLPPTPQLGGDSATIEATISSTGPPVPSKLWRAGVTAAAHNSPYTQSRLAMAMASIRIHKSDNSHTIISLPYNTTVSEMQSVILKKPGFMMLNGKIPAKAYKLYMRANGLERVMAPGEKPLQWQDRKFRAAGYDPDSDKLEDLGREDHSYLCKFIFKPEVVPVIRWEEENLESFDFIDLAARGIENLPVFLHKHAHEVISLNISRNPHLHLPTDFVQACTSLRELKMIEMGMKRIPQSVKEVPGLTRLDVSINRIVELEHCALYECKELTTFNAFNNRLTSLPDYFVHFKTLKYLNISNNRFETFPLVICEVLSHVDIDISFNNISTLPPEIGKLKHLETLILFCNNITALPTTIKLLKRLRRLDSRRNKIADFSPITSMPNLQSVRAQHNMAKALDLQADNLAILNLSHNPITRFTVLASDTASALTHLDLSHSRLETIPEELFTTCLSLQLLSINNNKIRTLSENVGNLQRLGTLSIKNNVLQSLPASIGKLQRLHTLEVSSNKLSVLPDTIWQCSELETLNASFNSLVEFPDPATSQSDGTDDADRTAPAGLGPPMVMSLRRLYLAYNRLRDDVLRPLSYMTGLVTLNLSFNDIYEIPNGMLRKCYQLTHLYLSGNMLTSLPADDLERLIHLKVLHLNGNKLQTLPAELGSIQTLQVLDVGSNALKYNIANWPYDWNWNWNLQLRYLNLSGNKRLEIKPSAQQAQELSPNGIPVKRRNLSDFSALTHLRVLGLMDVTLMIPSVPDESDARRVRTSLSSINEMGYGVADTLGASEYLSLIDLVVPRFRGKDDECVIGLFDVGMQERPGGAKIIKFIVDHFVQRLTLELSRLRDEDASQGLRRSFLSLNRDWGNTVTLDFDRARKGSDVTGLGDRFNANSANQSNVRASASAVVVYLYKKTLYVANVGDSMALIAGRTMLARDLTTKHEPCSTEEILRIRSAEGWVSPDGLVNDQAKSARGFGAFHVFPAVNCEPTVHVLDLVDSDEFVIIANNGFWRVVSGQMSVDIVWEHKSDPMLAAQKLRDLAIAYGAESSVVVMVISVGDLFKSRQPVLSRGLTRAHGGDLVFDRPRRPQGSIPGLRNADETAAPQGTVALVFTDIRNSTSLWETNPGMQNAMRIHHELLRRLIRAFDGYEVKTEGDAFMVSFSSVTSAVLWAFTVQLELLRADWPAELLMSEEGKELYGPDGELIYRGLSVRMGLHWGAPICEQDPVNHRMDYLGPMVNRAARVSGVAEGGQITASADAVEVLQAMLNASSDEEDKENPLVDPNQLDAATKRDIAAIRQLGCGIKEVGEYKLKGLETPEFLSLIYPSALVGRLSGGKSKEAMISEAQVALAKSDPATSLPPPRALLDHQDVRSLANLCLRLEALSAGNNHRLYELPSNTSTSNHNSPAIGAMTSTAAPRRRITLSPHLLSSTVIRSEAPEEELLVLLELFVVRIENALSMMQMQQMGPFTDVLSALGDAVKIEPKFILQALTMLSQML